MEGRDGKTKRKKKKRRRRPKNIWDASHIFAPISPSPFLSLSIGRKKKKTKKKLDCLSPHAVAPPPPLFPPLFSLLHSSENFPWKLLPPNFSPSPSLDTSSSSPLIFFFFPFSSRGLLCLSSPLLPPRPGLVSQPI